MSFGAHNPVYKVRSANHTLAFEKNCQKAIHREAFDMAIRATSTTFYDVVAKTLLELMFLVFLFVFRF